MSHPMKWPAGANPEWLLEKIQKMELLVIRSREEAEQSSLYGTRLDILKAWGQLGQELADMEHKLGGPSHAVVFLLSVIHNMLAQEVVDVQKVCRDMTVNPCITKGPRANHIPSVLDLFLDNAEREYR